jgi:hypothetical protein
MAGLDVLATAPRVRQHQRRSLKVAAADEDANSSRHTQDGVAQSSSDATDLRLKKTMSGLDALLGITEEPKKSGSATAVSSKSHADSASVNGTTTSNGHNSNLSISPEAMRKLADAESQRLSGGDPGKAGPLRDDLEAQFQRIIARARKLADEQVDRWLQAQGCLQAAFNAPLVLTGLHA